MKRFWGQQGRVSLRVGRVRSTEEHDSLTDCKFHSEEKVCWLSQASLPQLRRLVRKEFSLVEVFKVVLYVHNTLGNSSAQTPLYSSSFIFKLCFMILLTASTWPFVWGWSTEETFFLIPSSSQNSLNSLLSNYVSLCETISWGMSYRHIIASHTKSWTF